MKNENQTLRRAVHLALGAAVMAPLVADQGVAYAASGTIETVGSRIGRSSIEGPNPVVLIERADIERTGLNTVADVLKRMPINGGNSLDETFTNSFAPGAASIDLRGLGRNRTLVLLNGRRVANYGFAQNITEGFVDVNSIPLAAVERIEVLKDGASAIYGADAVAGVVNIVMRKNYEGVEVNAGYGDSQDGGAAETNLSMVAGKNFGKATATFVLDYFHRDDLLLADRKFSESADHGRTRNGDGFNFNSSYGNPGSALGSFGFQPDPACGSQPPSTFGPTGLPGTYGQVRGGRCRFDYNVFITAIPEVERLGSYLQSEIQLSPTTTGWIELGYQDNDNKAQAAPTPVTSTPIVAANNPYNPFGEDVYWFYRLTDAGPRKSDVKSKTYRFLGGLKGSAGQYDWETAYLYTKNKTTDYQKNYLSSAAIAAGINDYSLIPFGGVTQSPAAINKLYINTDRKSESELWLVDGKITGPAWGWKMPGGPVNFALGAEFRHEKGTDTPDIYTLNNDVEASGGTASQGERDVKSVYGELQLPVTENLEVLAALRYEDSSSKSDTFTSKGNFSSTDPKVSFRYMVNDALSFRGSWGTAFRAPSLVEQFLGNTVSFVNATDTVRCNVTGSDQDCGTSQYQETFGGNPDLKPEEAESWNLGMVMQFTPKLSGTVDWWRIDHKDLISSDVQNLLDTKGNDPAYVQRRPATPADMAAGIPGEITNINDAFFNLSKQKVSGLDVDVRYDSDTWYYGVAATRWLKFDRASLSTDPLESVLGTRAGDVSYPEWRANAWVGRRWTDWEGEVGFRWESQVLDSTTDPQGNDHFIDALKVFDAQLSYTGFKNMKITVGCDNCSNEDPPFSYDEIEGFEVGRANPRGAFWYGRVSFDLGAAMAKRSSKK